LLQQICALRNHSNKRTRELARILLANIQYTDLVFENVETWVKSLDLGTYGPKVIEKLRKDNVCLYHLLNLEITLDHVLTILLRLDLMAGCVFSMIASLTQERNKLEIARKRGVEMAIHSNLKELEVSVSATSSIVNKKENTNKQLFISYCWANKTMMSRIYDILTNKGLSCWVDDGSMHGGSALFEEIDNGISACQVFISCCSNQYGSSTNCKREINLACDRKKLIIPILIGACDPWPPKGEMGPLLAGKIYIDLSTEENFSKNIENLIVHLK